MISYTDIRMLFVYLIMWHVKSTVVTVLFMCVSVMIELTFTIYNNRTILIADLDKNAQYAKTTRLQ